MSSAAPRRRLSEFLLPPRELSDTARLLIAAGARGELLVAWMRLLLVLAAMPVVAGRLLAMPGDPWSRRALVLAVAALLYALAVVALCRLRTCSAWLGYATAVVDVTTISLFLAIPLLGEGHDPEIASSLALGLYLLAIAASGLRFVLGITLFTGALAIVEYTGLIAVVDALWRPDRSWVPGLDAGVAWRVHAANLLFMALATFLSAAAVLRARQLRSVSIRDPLTGLYNRGCFDEALEEFASLARGGGRCFAVALLDLDHFKHYNDTLGHRAGDEILRHVACRLTESFRDEDVIGRYGGDEFGVVLPNLGIEQARSRIEQLRNAMAAASFSLEDGHAVGTVTFSAGIAACPADGCEAGEVLRCADNCLYAAKAAGRDRLMTSVELRQQAAPARGPVIPSDWLDLAEAREPVPVGER